MTRYRICKVDDTWLVVALGTTTRVISKRHTWDRALEDACWYAKRQWPLPWSPQPATQADYALAAPGSTP